MPLSENENKFHPNGIYQLTCTDCGKKLFRKDIMSTTFIQKYKQQFKIRPTSFAKWPRPSVASRTLYEFFISVLQRDMHAYGRKFLYLLRKKLKEVAHDCVHILILIVPMLRPTICLTFTRHEKLR